MRAIILAAGVGSRIRGHTASPKCLLRIDGKTLLQHQLDALQELGVSDVHVIVGYRSKEIIGALPGHVQHHVYSQYAETNNLWTLAAFSELLQGDCLVQFADVRVSRDALRDLLCCSSDVALLGDGRQCLEGTMRIRARGEQLLEVGSHIPVSEGHGNFIGLARFGAAASPRLGALINRCVQLGQRRQDYYTAVLPELCSEHRAHVVWLGGKSWAEVDDVSDLERAQAISFDA
ncbi:4-diphosphocytidyl-2C-methyl-D-erythritol synthase [Paracidovorax avenae ATCC 19860]|uniref:4-diphosphocytidyl-2C-methyl-D-erythritol synthase n=1 Tax=Paracidovorax avenae (strain ATCC 19860 / DSM 7227 / CCUG 15838 / JCM 20985 / LMG 2117 / NCPPB 1011) TaxID=643561 RepID=F0QAJ6_PARA1|nr:phosphocholine cytidylyltransferase family protein [Paracidovorax avenae]ADX46037.1 4-diphosphocytidyl-2C-methyl-D-erythritol synthase [Paracidovorax avenae ATCC 19860]AVS67716.1 phosphocholine cytidylyltransferase family protein [Paracidovorax avenae]